VTDLSSFFGEVWRPERQIRWLAGVSLLLFYWWDLDRRSFFISGGNVTKRTYLVRTRFLFFYLAFIRSAYQSSGSI